MATVTTNPDVVVLVLGEDRDEISEALADAEQALAETPSWSQDPTRRALRVLVDLVSDLQIGSETSNFLFPIPDGD
nr:hypothetical protein [Rhodococcus sp. 06-621-2]